MTQLNHTDIWLQQSCGGKKLVVLDQHVVANMATILWMYACMYTKDHRHIFRHKHQTHEDEQWVNDTSICMSSNLRTYIEGLKMLEHQLVKQE